MLESRAREDVAERCAPGRLGKRGDVLVGNVVAGAEERLGAHQLHVVEPGAIDVCVDSGRQVEVLGCVPCRGDPPCDPFRRLVVVEPRRLVRVAPGKLALVVDLGGDAQRIRELPVVSQLSEEGNEFEALRRGSVAEAVDVVDPQMVVDEARTQPFVFPGDIQVGGHQARVAAGRRGLVAVEVVVAAVAAVSLSEVAGDARRHPGVEGLSRGEGDAAVTVLVRGLPVDDTGRDSLEVLRIAGLHVDDRQLGVAAIPRRARTADDLDALDLVRGKLVTELEGRVEGLVHLLPVEKQQDLPFVSPDAAEADVGDAFDVYSRGEAGHELEHVEQVARAGGEDLVAGQQGEHAGAVANGGRPHRRDGGLLFQAGVGFEEIQLGLSPCGHAKQQERRRAEPRKPIAMHAVPLLRERFQQSSGSRPAAIIWPQRVVWPGAQLR